LVIIGKESLAMVKEGDRLVRVEENLKWIKDELVLIRDKVDALFSSRWNSRLVVAIFTVVVAWLSALTFLMVKTGFAR